MNGFVHSILSFMLSWIRALITNLWNLLSSDGGGALYRFLSQNWLSLVILLCLAGVAADLIVYFFRWRPYYVWRTRLRHLRRPKPARTEPVSVPDEPAYQEPAPETLYAPTTVYQPLSRPYAEMQEMNEPLFDDGELLWEDAAAPAEEDWAAQEAAQFGAPQPEPASYYRDMEAGYAPPVPPQQLYTPSASYQAPVHPGLNEDAFRQSFGLQTDEEALQERAIPVQVKHAPAFRPFTVVDPDASAAKAENPFARFAKRARTLVGMEDEDRAPTIRDLQSTVDVSQAFHEPVYPQANHHREG